MIKISAFAQDDSQPLPLLGTLSDIQCKKSTTIELTKTVTVNGIGNFKKKLRSPVYSQNSVKKHMSHNSTILGFLGDRKNVQPTGYVLRHSGMHHLCVPVYSQQDYSKLFYSVCGYVTTDNGVLAITKRKIGLWIAISLLACAVICTSILISYFGTDFTLIQLAVKLGLI